MLKLSGISKSFPGPGGMVPALREITLEVAEGDFAAICGPSGSGKSTLLLIAGALLTPDSGVVEFAGSDLYGMRSEQRNDLRASRIGFVFQQFHLLPYLTVRENVLTPSLAVPLKDAAARARDLLEQFGLGERADHLPAQLSTGEKQRTALARALLHRPALILADEPTGNLDDDNGATVLAALADFATAGGAVLMVTHDQAAATVTGRTLQMRDGRLSPPGVPL